jgi:hypothetical protein
MSATFPLFAPAASIADAVNASATMHPAVASMVMLETVRRDIRSVVKALVKARANAYRDASEILDCDAGEANPGDRLQAARAQALGEGIDYAIRQIITLLPEYND